MINIDRSYEFRLLLAFLKARMIHSLLIHTTDITPGKMNYMMCLLDVYQPRMIKKGARENSPFCILLIHEKGPLEYSCHCTSTKERKPYDPQFLDSARDAKEDTIAKLLK